MVKVKKRKRLLRGRDWDGYAFKFPEYEGQPESQWVFCHWAEIEKPAGPHPTDDGKWVRVKFVEVP